jgi:hypothetical protein
MQSLFVAATSAIAGGAIGAISMAVLSWTQLSDAARELESHLIHGEWTEIDGSARRLISQIGGFAAALGRLRSILRIP